MFALPDLRQAGICEIGEGGDDYQHCYCWWDEPVECCYCGFNGDFDGDDYDRGWSEW